MDLPKPFGKWRIYKYLIGRDPNALTMSEIKAMIGKKNYLED